MIVSELNMLLVNVARSNYLVKDAFTGDVYTINGKENKFGCFVATPMSALKQGIGLIRYTYVLYYIDRLTKAEDNTDFVQSDAVGLLSGVIDFIETQGIEVEPGYEFTLFRQQFGDWCAGAYVTVSFNVPYNDCNDGEFNLSGLGLGSISIDTNGIYEPVGVDGYNRITVNVPQVGATEEWVDDEITTRLEGYATEDWVNGRGFLTEHQDLSQYATIGYVDDAVDGLREELPDLTTYATKNWVGNQGYITGIPDTYATKTWVGNQGYIKSDALAGLATQTWVGNQGFLKDGDLEDYVLRSELDNLDYLKEEDIEGLASQNWVNNQGFLKDEDLAGFAATSWVENQGYITGDEIEDMATQTWVRNQGYIDASSLVGYATRSWVGQQGFLIEDDLCDYATKDWVNQQGFLVEDDLCGYATEEWTRNWVENQGYIKECDLEPYATKNWVENQGYATAEDLEAYATKQWVLDQDYSSKTWVTNEISTSLNGYATEEWVLNKNYATLTDLASKLDSDLIWSGTIEEWEEMTQEERCSYLIALIVE